MRTKTSKNHDAALPHIRALKKFLLTWGGRGHQRNWYLNSEVSPQLADLLMVFGVPYPGHMARLKLMEPSACHNNAARLVKKNKQLCHMIGFALSDDGCWRLHSWCAGVEGIIETTVLRDFYFG